MKTHLIFISFIISLCYSCRSNNSTNAKSILEDKSDVNYSSQIRSRCYFDTVVIWVRPTALELDSIESSLSKEEVETFEQDAGIYNTSAQAFLLSTVESKYFVADSVRIYKFILSGDTIELNTWDEQVKNSPWRIVLFNGKTNPILTSPANVERDYLKYFNK